MRSNTIVAACLTCIDEAPSSADTFAMEPGRAVSAGDAMDALVAEFGVRFGRLTLIVTDGKVVQVEDQHTRKNLDLAAIRTRWLELPKVASG